MIASLSEFDSRRLSLPSETESKKRSMIKELRVDYRKCFTNSALSSTAKRFSPTTPRFDTGYIRRVDSGWRPTYRPRWIEARGIKQEPRILSSEKKRLELHAAQ